MDGEMKYINCKYFPPSLLSNPLYHLFLLFETRGKKKKDSSYGIRMKLAWTVVLLSTETALDICYLIWPTNTQQVT